MEFIMTTRGARQLLKDLYNKRKTHEIVVILIGNAWEEGAAMGVVLELLLINTEYFWTELINTPIL